ncbi:hypothetical protein ACQKM9_20560 [Viridibacillus sp. NPDC093762]|uniref:hypothetical protein n=1 Tax=Viridibacillus sp. NPDC093762 TaxID=3390720 RepID=UPI003D06C6D7
MKDFYFEALKKPKTKNQKPKTKNQKPKTKINYSYFSRTKEKINIPVTNNVLNLYIYVTGKIIGEKGDAGG